MIDNPSADKSKENSDGQASKGSDVPLDKTVKTSSGGRFENGRWINDDEEM